MDPRELLEDTASNAISAARATERARADFARTDSSYYWDVLEEATRAEDKATAALSQAIAGVARQLEAANNLARAARCALAEYERSGGRA